MRLTRAPRLPRAPDFPTVLQPDALSRVALGGPLTTETVLAAYRRGIFPWSGDDPVPWCATDPRLVLRPTWFRSSRSLEKLARQGKYHVAFDRNFSSVMEACAGAPRPGQRGTWITGRMIDVYTELHRRGVCHSVEALRDGRLCGGLYGLTLGRAFFGESMFAAEPNTSKLALRALCRALEQRYFHFIDCQQVTPHLLRLGAQPIRLTDFSRWLEDALEFPSLHASWSDWGALDPDTRGESS
jgi:leucyl/phenylalanyl-tRNA--protein transferase